MINPHSQLFRLACKAVKYFFVCLFGVGITGLLAITFGVSHLFVMLLPCLWAWLLRFGITIGCLFATAVLAESLSS